MPDIFVIYDVYADSLLKVKGETMNFKENEATPKFIEERLKQIYQKQYPDYFIEVKWKIINMMK
jgi:hypothetical protein